MKNVVTADTLGPVLPWAGLLAILLYGLLVRFVLRRVMAGFWPFFVSKASVPYFMLFVGLMGVAAIQLFARWIPAAQSTLSIGYDALVAATIVELLDRRISL